MRIVSAQEVERWIAGGKILEKDGRGPKVVALNDELYLKIFHTRRHPLLARLQPAAKRFAKNADRLKQAGIPTPEIIELLWLDPRTGLSACLYRPLPGRSIEQIHWQSPQQVAALLPSLGHFIRQLHLRGIYFRSLHLGNILLLPEGGFGLIDILDLKIKRPPLNRWHIARNFAHLRRYLDRKKIEDFPLSQLLEHYRDNH